MAKATIPAFRELLTDAERARDEGAYLRIPPIFAAACTLQTDLARVKRLFVEAGIPETALQHPIA